MNETAFSSKSRMLAEGSTAAAADLKTDIMAGYAGFHELRFAYLLQRITKVLPAQSHVMDMGCHFLDQALLLRKAGYAVHGFDASAFTEMPSVKRVAHDNQIELSTIHDLSLGEFGADIPDSTFDAMVFAEIIEHLAFNPLLMWKSIFRLLKPNAFIFVSTPNGLGIRRRVKEIIKIVLGMGKGPSLKEIFGSVTYGHHWKEYGRSELIKYFNFLGIPRENIQVFRYHYRKPPDLWKQGKVSWALSLFMDRVPALREELFLVAKLPPSKPTVPAPPAYS
jgi:2-polyprenyl-6-hydroxyphenyl methylase/3-demethylubiquinone-9 3-methyltransferase